MNKKSNQGNSENSQNGFSNGIVQHSINSVDSNSHQENHLELSIGRFLIQLWVYKWILLSFLVVFALLSFLLAWTIQPVYQANGTLLINESKNQYSYSGSDISNLLTTSYGLGIGSSLVNQLEIIRSRRVAAAIADRILENSQMPNKHKYPILWTDFPDDSTTISKEQLVNRVKNKLSVDQFDNGADIATVSFKSYSPLEAATIANLIMDTYTTVSAQKNRESARLAREFLNTQRQKMSNELESAETDLKSFQEKTGLVSVDVQTNNDFQKISQLEQKKQEQRIKLFSINTAIEKYQAELEKIKPDFSENFAQNVAPMISQLQEKLADLEAQRIVLISKNPRLEKNPDREPQLVDLNKQIGSLKANIRSKANTILANDSTGFISSSEGTERLAQLRQNLIQARIEQAQAQAKLSVIDQMQSDEESQMDDVPEKMLKLARLQRNLSMKENLYKTISQQYAETSLWEQTQSGTGSPLDYAIVPKQPVEPNVLLFIIIGLVLGGIAGLGFIIFRVETHTEIDTPERLSEIPYPLLSVIPNFMKEDAYKEYTLKEGGNKSSISKNWITMYDSNSVSAEAFRKLQNNILYSRPDESLKTLMITSSEQGEGKTSVSLNLATTLTEAGKRVLVVDSDLRRPNLHKLAGINKLPGLMDIIFEDKSIEECIQETLHKDVFVLAVGKRPPNPSAVLRSAKMAQIMAEVRKKYDYILFDTPPLGVVGDAAPLIRYIEGVIVVAKFKQTKIGNLYKLVNDLEHLNAPILGTVLTGFDPQRSSYSYYHNAKSYYSYQSYEKYVDKV